MRSLTGLMVLMPGAGCIIDKVVRDEDSGDDNDVVGVEDNSDTDADADADGDADADVGWSSVSAGSFHTCGVTTSGSIECWGGDDYGRSTPPER